MLGKSYTEFLWIIDDLSQVETHILVDSLTWLPRRMELKAFGGIENWEFIGWENVMFCGGCVEYFVLPLFTV